MLTLGFLETGSLDELSNLVQAELDLSTELDNTLLSQVVGGLGLDNTAMSAKRQQLERDVRDSAPYQEDSG